MHMVKPYPPRQTKNLCGQYFGKLQAIGYAGTQYTPPIARWLCKCECGRWKFATGYNLMHGQTRSCGCLHKSAGKARTTHGESKSTANTTEYRTYHAAKARCIYQGDKDYPRYGARGIKFCFETFEQFLAEVGRKPTPKHSLDRIDVNGHYEPGNVRWLLNKYQCRNRRKHTRITAFGRTQLLAEWVEESGTKRVTLSYRLKRGWCAECAISLPIGDTCSHH